jgi:hypothetical protein
MKREASSSSFSPPFLSGVPALKGGHTFLKGNEKIFRDCRARLRRARNDKERGIDTPDRKAGGLASMGISF